MLIIKVIVESDVLHDTSTKQFVSSCYRIHFLKILSTDITTCVMRKSKAHFDETFYEIPMHNKMVLLVNSSKSVFKKLFYV